MLFRSAQIEVTEQTLADLGAGDIPVIRVMNKSDVAFADADGISASHFPKPQKNRIWISARSGEGINDLLDAIDEVLNAGSVTCTFLIPYAESGVENMLRRDGIVYTCEYGEDGITVNASLEKAFLSKYEKYLVK